MKVADIIQLRLQNQHLASPVFKNPADIVYHMGAVQAQDYSGAKWAIAQRLVGANDDLIEKAFTDGDIIRTHVMRPTWHFVSPHDIRWMLELTAPRVQSLSSFRHRQLKLDKGIFAKCEKALIKALEGGRQLARNDVAAALQQAGVSTDEQRFVHIMMEMELIGLVCSGGRQGKQFTYALLNERVPQTKAFERDETLAALAERYFVAHGPATLQDYVWWCGLTVADAKAGIEMIKDKLASSEFEGNTYWFTERSADLVLKSSSAYLLPNYDEYIVSYKDRSAAIEASNIDKADPRGTIFNNTIVVNGRVIGTWKHSFRKNTIVLEIIPFKPLSKANETAINAAAKRYTRFWGLKDFVLQICK